MTRRVPHGCGAEKSHLPQDMARFRAALLNSFSPVATTIYLPRLSACARCTRSSPALTSHTHR